MDSGLIATIAEAFATMAPSALFIGLCERIVGILVRAFSGKGLYL